MRHALAAIFVAGIGCSEARSHIFLANRLEEPRSCLLPEQGVDIVSGAGAGRNCSAVCITAGADGGVFVSTMCPPYPTGFAMSDPRCSEAMEAFARKDFCTIDGGSTHPRDGGLDSAAAITDAAEDAVHQED